MATEICILCKEPGTPWKYVEGHICCNCSYGIADGSLCSGWISIKDRLPERSIDVLATDGARICISQYQYDNFQWVTRTDYYSYDFNNVTHWLPLPKLRYLNERNAI